MHQTCTAMGTSGIEPVIHDATALPLSYVPVVGLRLTENRTSPNLAFVSVLTRQANWVWYICSQPRLPVRLMKPLGHIRKCSIRQLASLRLRVPHFRGWSSTGMLCSEPFYAQLQTLSGMLCNRGISHS